LACATRFASIACHTGLASSSVAALRDATRGAVNLLGPAFGSQAKMGATAATTHSARSEMVDWDRMRRL
jgi:hypothetical protein